MQTTMTTPQTIDKPMTRLQHLRAADRQKREAKEEHKRQREAATLPREVLDAYDLFRDARFPIALWDEEPSMNAIPMQVISRDVFDDDDAFMTLVMKVRRQNPDVRILAGHGTPDVFRELGIPWPIEDYMFMSAEWHSDWHIENPDDLDMATMTEWFG